MFCDYDHGDGHISQIVLCSLLHIPSGARRLCAQARDARHLHGL